MITLTIDIGGTGTKMIRLDADARPISDRDRELTARPAHPEPVLAVIETMVERQGPFDRVAVGFPGVIVRGVAQTAPNLDTEAWRGFDLQSRIAEMTGKPTRAINDADLQGYGVIEGEGVELVLTLGTGLGTALFSDGHLVANLEFGHHPFGPGETYEERVRDSVFMAVPEEEFVARVRAMLDQLQPIFNYERVYIGGGNAKALRDVELPDDVRLFENEEGMRGGVRVWEDALDRHG